MLHLAITDNNLDNNSSIFGLSKIDLRRTPGEQCFHSNSLFCPNYSNLNLPVCVGENSFESVIEGICLGDI